VGSSCRRSVGCARALDLDELDVLMIADEVITGFGRTGRCSPSSTTARPDLMTVAKGITSVTYALAAIARAARDAFADDAKQENVHPHLRGHPVACRRRSPTSRPSRRTISSRTP